jgi:hypothetical protein
MTSQHRSRGTASRRESDTRKVVKEEFQDIAKFGSEILKKTVVSGLGALKDVTDGLPKEAQQILSKGKDELFKTLASKDVLSFLLTQAVDRGIDVVRQHRLDISIRIRKVKEKSDSRPRSRH